MPFKQAYISSFKPVFPMNEVRANKIYNSIARAISNVCPRKKTNLLNQLMKLSADFNFQHSTVLQSQDCFNAWHNSVTEQLMLVPFSWTDKSEKSHATLPFGAAQKMINLALKDWWAISPSAFTSNCHFLHAPLDQIVYASVRRVFGALPSLKGKKGIPLSYIYNLKTADYYVYQTNIQAMAASLSASLKIPLLLRVEVDQLLWKWV